MTIEGMGTLLAWAEFWLLIYADCDHEQYVPRNRWSYGREEIEREVRQHCGTCSMCPTR